nr:MAG TPA: hypothetical protein [Caudoviricetes sp.]
MPPFIVQNLSLKLNYEIILYCPDRNLYQT